MSEKSIGTENVIHGFKGFNDKLQCTPDGKVFQYAVGETYEEPEAVCCKNGFHFCVYPLDVFNYYSPHNSRFATVDGSGIIDSNIDNDDTKKCSSRLKIVAEIGISGLVQAAVKFAFDRCTMTAESQVSEERKAASATGNRGAASATGDLGAASATGNLGAASATGDLGAASATGYQGAASATGDRGAASATGNRGAASATGDLGAASATGNRGAASATGDLGAASATGYQGAAIATGYQGAASATGYQGAAIATGYQGAASATGDQTIACAHGVHSKAKATKGNWIVCSEWKEIDNKWVRVGVKSALIDGKKLKEDTYYTIKDGEFEEA